MWRIGFAVICSLALISEYWDGLLEWEEVEAVPSVTSEGVETGAGKGTSEAGAEIDAYSTPAKKGGQALMFESQRQQEESSEEVSHYLLLRE